MRRELADLAVRAEPDAAPQETRGLAAMIEDLRRQLEVPSRHGAAMAARLSRAEEAARTAQETCRRLTAQNRLLQGEIDAVERGLLAECDDGPTGTPGKDGLVHAAPYPPRHANRILH